ncbi:LacI family DNA-binding transcriptional regulator [Aestuariimicrobium ganziense]|uniref:LacI family DNA-binding transcriptional regulator n=1 Tax=Aestuariimicrobium ganziense TaxID=2773677 RepID=UPI0019444957|nr:LacI family DNA-binding transcriptional regulator [Aestuariimicrobium ganziense]
MKQSPTLVDVAKHAGVSPMTVSRVLAGSAHVRPELQEKVHASVAALGYRRNENARHLRQGKGSGLIGVAITNIDNPYYAELVLGIEDVARQSGRRLLLGTTQEDSERESRLIDDFIGRQVEGLIVVPSGGRGHLRRARPEQTPLVFASRTVAGIPADAVLVDDVNGAYDGATALLTRGHRRVAFLGNSESVSTSRRRLEGFLLAHEDAGVEPEQQLIRLGGQTADQAQQIAEQLLALPEPPDAFFATNNRNSLGVLNALGALYAAGRLDGPPGLAFFDHFELSDFVPWPMVLVVHDAREVGRLSAQLLLDHLAADAATWLPRSVQVPTTLLHLPGHGLA